MLHPRANCMLSCQGPMSQNLSYQSNRALGTPRPWPSRPHHPILISQVVLLGLLAPGPHDRITQNLSVKSCSWGSLSLALVTASPDTYRSSRALGSRGPFEPQNPSREPDSFQTGGVRHQCNPMGPIWAHFGQPRMVVYVVFLGKLKIH